MDTTVGCPICGAGVDGPDPAAVARGVGWVELPGVWLCPACALRPDVWATVAVETVPISSQQSVIRFAGIPIMLGAHASMENEALSLRSSLAGLIAAAMAAARRG